MIIIGYLLLAIVIFSFLRYPKWGVLIAIFLKPTIDMFWWVKTQGFISPLFIVGVAVPLLAIVALSKIHYRRVNVPLDKLIVAYLVTFAAITSLKLINAPQFAYNSIDSIARILSVTLFYFIGRFYFQSTKDRKLLVIAILGSVVFPFALTLGQGLLGINLTHFSDVYAAAGPGVDTGDISGYYLGGRHGISRISGVYEGIYELAFMGVIAVVIVFALKEAQNFKLRYWHYAILFSGIYLLYFTYSRSAWITITTTFSFYFLLQRKFLHFLVLVGVCLLLYFSIESVQFRFEDELGFFIGETGFDQFGHGRGAKWKALLNGFLDQDLSAKLIGNYGIGNAENQFLGMMFGFGYIGLFVFTSMQIILTVKLSKAVTGFRTMFSAEDRIKSIMACFAMASYWFAGQGNYFMAQISIQWVIWIWVGIIASDSMRSRASIRSGRSNHFQ